MHTRANQRSQSYITILIIIRTRGVMTHVLGAVETITVLAPDTFIFCARAMLELQRLVLIRHRTLLRRLVVILFSYVPHNKRYRHNHYCRDDGNSDDRAANAAR